MTISPLSVQQIVAVIRQQMVDQVRPNETGTASVSSAQIKKNDSKRGRAAKPKKGGLSNLIGHRVSALQENDPERGRKAFRIFLESVLLNELGEGLINDHGFYQLVDDIHLQMESTPDIAEAMQEAIAQLLAGTPVTNKHIR